MTQNKGVAVIIGGLGSIGLAISNFLAESQFFVIASSTKNLDNITNLHPNIRPVLLHDASNFQQVEDLFFAVKQEFGSIDIAVNCAGSIFLKPAHQTKFEDFENCLKANLYSSFALLKAATKIMINQKANCFYSQQNILDKNFRNGAILLFSSVAGKIGLPNHEAISASKAAIEGMVRSAAATYASKNICINAIAPGLVKTSLSKFITENQGAMAVSTKMHPLGRVGEVSDILNVAKMLLCLENNWITGQIISVDGGMSTIKNS